MQMFFSLPFLFNKQDISLWYVYKYKIVFFSETGRVSYSSTYISI